MLHHLYLPVVFCLAALPAWAQCSGPSFLDQITPAERAAIDAAVAATPFGEGLLWQATRDGATLTIVGTVHVDTPALPALRAHVAPYVASADLVLVEATAAEETAMLDALADNPALYLITEGPTLPELLDPALWDQIVAAAEARQMPGFMIAQFQPWYLSLTLAIPPCAMGDLINGVRGLDHLIMEDATANGIPIAPLEPWDTLFNLLSHYSLEEQIAQLSIGLPPAALQESMFTTMIDGYAKGQTALMWEASRIALNYIPNVDPVTAQQLFDETEAALLSGRNLAWLPVIDAAAVENPAIVLAFGAAHLPGEFGVLNLLEQDGWTVTPLP